MNMKQQSNLICKLLLLLLMLAGTSSAWARTSTYKIVNNKGEVVFHVRGTSAKPALPDKAQSPFATNYRYYQYEEDAQLDARSGAAAAASKQLNPDLNLSYDGDVFVRYDYNAEANVKDQAGKTLRIDGTAAYNFTICDYTGTPNGRYVWYNASSTVHNTHASASLPSGDEYNEKILVKPYNTAAKTLEGSVSDEDKKTAAYQWRFIGQRNGYEGSRGNPDPYDIKIVSVADASMVVTGIYTRGYDAGPTDQQYIHLTYLADDNNPQHVQRFFFRKLSNTVQIAAAAPLYLYLSGGSKDNDPKNAKDMWFVLNKEAGEPEWYNKNNGFQQTQCFQALHMRLHAKHEIAKNIDNGSEKRSNLIFYRQETRKYIILDKDGNKVAAANAAFDEMNDLQVPASIASALPGTTYTYYTTKADAIGKKNAISSSASLPDVIYVRYEFAANNAGNQVKLDGSKAYNMKLNGTFVKYQEGAGQDSDVNLGTEEASEGSEYAWQFKGSDPYHIQLTVEKTGAGYITGESTGTTITLHTGNKTAALQANATASGHTPSTYYLVKSPAYSNEKPVFLLRASYVGEGATTEETDDDPNFYTWAYGGDETDWNEARPRLYSSAYIEDGDEALQMELEELLDAPGVTYRIIDKSDRVVVEAQTRKKKLDVPAPIKSPLVSKFYYYLDTQVTYNSSDQTYTLNANPTELASTAAAEATTSKYIYVTYDVGTDIKIDNNDGSGRCQDKDTKAAIRVNGTYYLLKFLNGKSYYQEDGSNGVTTVTKKAEVPYANGDANMNVYDQDFTDATFRKGASERTRMPWALIGGDPYRLKITSYQSQHKRLINTTDTESEENYFFSYFRTYYNKTLKQIVTNVVSDDPLERTHTDPKIADPTAVPTEYMILGTTGKYKLVTSEKISDGTTDEQRTLNTFEQYWKNYETIQDKLGGGVMPADADLTARGWHKYPAWAYSKPLDGGDKEWDYGNHWYQTFEVGDVFELQEVSMNPSLVLIDKHGWEIMRSGLPVDISKVKAANQAKETANNAAKQTIIRRFNSPMVKAYHWYKKAEKVTGYHKYIPTDPALAESGDEEYTSTDLNDYPPSYDTNPGDWYVTYDVKDEYSFLYDNATGHSAPVLIKQGGKYLTATGATTFGNSTEITYSGTDDNLKVSGVTDAALWYLSRNKAFDHEAGYLYSNEEGHQEEALTQAATESQYSRLQQGFDPYNLQISSKVYNTEPASFFKINATNTTINSSTGLREGTFPAGGGVLSLATVAKAEGTGYEAHAFTATGYEGTQLKVTNATFMAVQDSLGNMRLMPRFAQRTAITNLTSGSPTVTTWETAAAANDESGAQTIILQPVQKYLFEVRAANSSTLVASSLSAFYARPGASIYTTLGDVSIPLSRELIRSYCDYPAAYTSYTEGTNTYANAVTCYPLGDGTGISSDGVKIFVPYYVQEDLFSTEESPSWYNIAFETKNQYIQANTSTHAVSGSGAQTADVSKWAFLGSPYDLKIFNKAEKKAGHTGHYLAMNADGTATLVSETNARNHWTLVYNDNGNPIMRLTTQIDSKDAYIKKYGEATTVTTNPKTYPNDDVCKIFLTNLVTVTYHVCHGTAGTPSSWSEDYTESLDYEVNQLEDYPGLPETVALPLCTFKYYKTEADMKAGTNTFNSFSGLYATLGETEKISNMNIYLSYDVQYDDNSSPVKFFANEAEARASMEWSFLMQGVESAAIVYGTQNKDYGHENARMGKTARTYGSDIASLKPAERTFTQHSDIPVMGGFHFIRRTSALQVDAATGAMTVPETNDSIGLEIGARYIPSQNAEVNASLMSPLNDFRRIAETYKDGKDTKFRENSWLWAFIGTPYKFEIINREALVGGSYNADNMPEGGTYKRLAQVIEKGTPYLKLVTDTVGKKIYWTLEQLDNYGDDETKFSFHIKSYDENKIMSRTSASTSTMRVINTPPISDIAYLKSTAFMVYPWNWTNNKYKTVTVNIYKDAASGTPVLTKTYTPADRAFMAGDVIDGTDGHFYLPLDGTADGTTWKEKGVINHTMPYDGHKINIPYEMRRKHCIYTVPGGSFTVGATDAEQTLNIVYTLDPNTLNFVPEDQLSAFRSTSETGTFNGKLKKDYYYFVDMKDDLSQHYYMKTPTYQGTSSDTRFAAERPDQAKFYFVGDPYNIRIYNVYAQKNGNSMNVARSSSDNTTSLQSTATNWEMVDASSLGVSGYNASSSNISYRLDYLKTKTFALRTKGSGDNPTYYYLGKDGKTWGDSIYVSSSTPQMNKLAAFRDYPDSRHAVNAESTLITLMRPVVISVNVYDQDEPSKFVTKDEESEFYAKTERFRGIPSNLQRNYCNYTWVSTEATPSGTNNQLNNGYFVLPSSAESDREFVLYAKYEETDDSPFSRLDEHGNPVLKKNAAKSPWYNMNIGNRWAFFNSGLSGLRYTLNGQTAWNTTYGNKPNNSELTFPYGGSSLPNANLEDRFRKGLHWALVGDPYNFQLRCQRDIIEFTGEGDSRVPAEDASGNYIYTPAYIKGAPVDDATETVVPSMDTQENATWWTWIRERSSSRYFLSESLTRRTVIPESEASGARANGPRRLPENYPGDPAANPPAATLNFKIGDASYQGIVKNQGVISRGDGYGIGDQMHLLSVDDVDANNECFDANVTVYNKINEPVATSGWREYARENVKSNGRISTDVQRWGCTYHYWADETMTRYPFTAFNQKDEDGKYLIQDKGTVYVTYDYDESLYSSENEYRWLNPFYNWDKETTVDEATYTETQEGWIYSPATGGTKDKAMCDQTNQSTDKEQKWAMIGDPYRFILYNYNRKKDAGGNNSYYLYYDGTNIVNHDFAGTFTPSKAQQQGIYFTWKVDGTSFRFAKKKDGANETEYFRRENLPETFYNFNGAGTNHIQTGYLAVCDMEKTSLTDASKLLGSIVGYTTFDDGAAASSQYMTEAESAAKRYLVMPMQQHAATVTFHLDPTIYTNGTAIQSARNFTTDPVFDYTTDNFGVDNTITLPWMLRRQYCNYTFYLIEAGDNNPATYGKVDALTYANNTASNAHAIADRTTGDYATFWKDGVTNQETLGITLHESGELEIPSDWNGKHVYLRVTYQPTANFITSTNEGATDGAKAANVKWLNIANQEKGNMLQYTRSQKVIGSSRENGENATNDYLWAVEGDPYGFKLHNRYATDGIGTTYNANWSTVMTTAKVNSTENYNYLDGVDGSGNPRNANFTYDEDGNAVKKSNLLYGKAGTADAFGEMSTTTTNAVYEAMTGNYADAMLIHPVNACINVRNQNGMKYYGAFLFNGAPTNYPVQLNYLQEWEAMRNVYANWKLQKPTAAQITNYFDRAGYVGGLTAEVATENATLFGKVKGGTATDSEFDTAWALVHNPANLVQLTNGYYRLRAYSSFDNGQYTQEQLGGHYVSGYLHKLEQTYEDGTPLHIYGKTGSSSAINSLTDLYGNEWAEGFSNNTALEIPDTEFDPSSVFYVTRDGNYITMKTQGLVVSDNKMIEEPAEETNAMLFEAQNIGQTAFQMRTKASAIAETPAENTYLSCNPNVTKYGLNIAGNELNVYEGAHDARIHDTKWLLEPVGAAATNAAETTYQRPLKLKLTNVGEDMFYATVCFPFNVTMPAGAYAYSCTQSMIRGESSQSSTGTTNYKVNIGLVAGVGSVAEMRAENNNRILPAGVPAIIYVDGWDADGNGKKVTDPTMDINFTPASSSDITLNAATLTALRNCPLKYQYLTQELPSTEVSDDDWVFVFSKSGNNVGFMRNTTKDYTNTANNKFVVHNRLYYIQPKSDAPSGRIALNFVNALEVSDDPISTNIQELQNKDNGVGNGDNTIYDLQGRKVTNVTRSGVYIVNGKKVVIHTK